jgi:hypothetical protein
MSRAHDFDEFLAALPTEQREAIDRRFREMQAQIAALTASPQAAPKGESDDEDGSVRWLDRRIADLGDEDKHSPLYQHYVNLRNRIRRLASPQVQGGEVRRIAQRLEYQAKRLESGMVLSGETLRMIADSVRALAAPAAQDQGEGK